MKRFAGKTLVCGWLAILPVALLEGMWSDPGLRGYARKFDGSVAMWISFPLYLLIVFLFWSRWLNRPDSREN